MGDAMTSRQYAVYSADGPVALEGGDMVMDLLQVVGSAGESQTDVSGALVVATDSGDAELKVYNAAADSSYGRWTAVKARGGYAGDRTIVQNGDNLFILEAYGYDGSSFRQAGYILMEVGGVPGSADMPGRIQFATTADGASSPTPRWRIEPTGTLKPVFDSTVDLAQTAVRIATGYLDDVVVTDSITLGSVEVLTGSGSPESAVTAPVGSLFLRDDGGASTTLYVKESGAGNTGWAAK